ncbi:MAG: hypothetical protein Q4D96_03750 [Propionibacteriaceae bacterium]|nr:hypothetical protein [Propionibacteriaceae bacterium]
MSTILQKVLFGSSAPEQPSPMHLLDDARSVVALLEGSCRD